MTTTTITYSDLREALEICMPHVNLKDADILPVFAGINITCDGETIQFEATDRYSAARYRATPAGESDPLDVLVSAKHLRQLLPLLNPGRSVGGHRTIIEITSDDDQVTFASAGLRLAVPRVEGSWPKLDYLFHGEASEVDSIGFNPHLLARMPKHGQVRAVFGGPDKPVRFVSLDDRWAMVIMPVRLSGLEDLGWRKGEVAA